MNVFVVVNSAIDGSTVNTDISIFEKAEHFLPSVKLSFHKVPDLTFKHRRESNLNEVVEVMNPDGSLRDTIELHCISVYKGVEHL
jgi:hypothetical protein